MRYLRFSGEVPNLESLQKRGRELSATEQRQRRKATVLHKCGTVVFWTVFLSLSAGLILLINWLLPEDDSVFDVIINTICGLCLGIVAVIISAIVGAIAATPLWGKQQNAKKAMLREALNESCAALRQFYQFGEPFLVTKCYCSSDKRFDRHDVCIYVVDNELRITANLHYGFFDPTRDLGCYCMAPQEIQLTDAQHKTRPAVELQADGVRFTLGSKAQAFIKAQFIGRTDR